MKRPRLPQIVPGGVLVKAKLTNGLDEELAHCGKLKPEQVRSCVVDALAGTEIMHTVLPAKVVRDLGLGPSGQHMVEHADGRREMVSVSEWLLVEVEGRDTIEDALIVGDEVIIGHTVIRKLDLYVDCAGRRLVPNPAHPDQPVTKVKRLI